MGVGKIRHLEVKTLWIQELVAKAVLSIVPVRSQNNMADIGTKCLTRQRIDYLKKLLGVRTLTEIAEAHKCAIKKTAGRCVPKAHYTKGLSMALAACGAVSIMPVGVKAACSKGACEDFDVEMYDTFVIKTASLFLCIGLAVGVIVGILCGRKVYKTKVEEGPESIFTRKIKVQSQTTFKRKCSGQPDRFKPLADQDHGGWSDD